jgi:pyruvate dehydrogenase E2 component (dihydrolipoyllysine-residue acetyltransferase)
MGEQNLPFGTDLPAWPQPDFAAFGEIAIEPLPRRRKVAAGYLARNWVTIPHVTHHDLADITALDQLRKQLAARDPGSKLTPLPFLVKAVVAALRAHRQFNASLDLASGSVIYKKYFHIGIAVDTPNGLLVPVVHNCDTKSVVEIGREITRLSEKARITGLALAEQSGGCFSISSLGSIGGTAFTPIINAPEVAILGVCPATWSPTRAEDDALAWRLMLPLSLSYDHRLINGADAARFMRHLAEVLREPSSLFDQAG